MNPFVLDWMKGESNATQFLPRAPEWRTGNPARPDRRDRLSSTGLIRALIESNRRWGLFVDDALAAWSRGETRTIVAGQQVGFAGGPLYTLAKIAALVKMKRELESAGTPVTAFFWLATEDHDFDEVARLSVPVSSVSSSDVNRQLDLLTLRSARSIEMKTMVGPLPIPEPLIAQLLTLYSMQRPEWLREGITFRDSFAELVATVVGGEVVLVDALLPELRRAGAPLFQSIFDKWDDVQRALSYRSGELEAAGYGTQVETRDDNGYTLLFEIDNDSGERRIIDSPRSVEPERISTSALTRPLLQDFVLQPDVFVGGPAEVSYYAQIAPLHRALQIEQPRVALRGHLLIAPKRVLRFIERFEIAPERIFSSADEMLTDQEPEVVAEIKRLTAEAREELTTFVTRVGELALPADHSLARAINRSTGHLEFHVGKFAERAIKGVVRKDRERYAAARELIATLYPDRQVQDRVVGWFPFWHQYGAHLMTRAVEEIEPDSEAFKVISI
jgi:uncharacterized protein YllA (UPF0747 family)